MRATEWEEAAEAAQEVANRETLSAAYWKDKASAVSATERSTRDDVLEEIANLAFRLPIYKMCGADVANYIRSLKSASADNTTAQEGKGA
jgi:hypothetical protein